MNRRMCLLWTRVSLALALILVSGGVLTVASAMAAPMCHPDITRADCLGADIEIVASGAYTLKVWVDGQWLDQVPAPGYSTVTLDWSDYPSIDTGQQHTLYVELWSYYREAQANATFGGPHCVEEELGSIGDRVWEDSDRDGQQDPDEMGLPGVTVNLYAGACPPSGTAVRTTETEPGTSGSYMFEDLELGTYCVAVDESTLPAGLEATTINQPLEVTIPVTQMAAASISPLEVTSPASNMYVDADFGYFYPQPDVAVSKTLNGPYSVGVGHPASFTIRVTNTGDTWIGVLPLTDVYSTTYLSYGYSDRLGEWTWADPPSGYQNDDGRIDWSDLTESFGEDLAPGASFSVVVTFTAQADTMLLPGSETVNMATVCDARPLYAPGLLGVETLPERSDEDSLQITNPTAVMLAGLYAEPRPEGVRITWQTANELQVVGFRLLRQTGGGDWEQVNKEFIFAQKAGEDQGSDYAYLDKEVDPGETCLYLVEVMLTSGATESHTLQPVTTPWWLSLPLLVG